MGSQTLCISKSLYRDISFLYNRTNKLPRKTKQPTKYKTKQKEVLRAVNSYEQLIEIREHCFPSNSLNIQFISILFIDLEKILIYNHNPPLKLYSIFHTRNCNTLGIKDTIWWTYTPGNDALQDSHHSNIQISNQFGEDEEKKVNRWDRNKTKCCIFYPFATFKH